jgi:hypothetical protein
LKWKDYRHGDQGQNDDLVERGIHPAFLARRVAEQVSAHSVDGLEDRFDLLVLQIIDDSLPGTFKWDAEDPLRQFQVLGVPGGDEVKERVDRGKPDVARRHTVLPFLLHVGKEGQDAGGIDIDQIELSDSLSAFGGKKTGSLAESVGRFCGRAERWS